MSRAFFPTNVYLFYLTVRRSGCSIRGNLPHKRMINVYDKLDDRFDIHGILDTFIACVYRVQGFDRSNASFINVNSLAS